MNATPPPVPPFDSCYWVIPGQFLAGEYPASKYNEAETRRRLGWMLMAGLDTWIDLTRPGELPAYQSILQEEAEWMERRVEYRRFSIDDFHIPPVEMMENLLAYIQSRLEGGHAVYVHCHAGIGRTGTVVGCFLARRLPGGGAAALEELARLRLPLNSFSRSPESQAQRDLVLNWK